MDLLHSNPEQLKKEGRNFDCKTCHANTMKLRRCREDREDFDYKDGAIWPMSVTKGGQTYGFCPAKATWDQELTLWYNVLVIVAETGQMPDGKPLADQDSEFVETLSWFLQRYNTMKFARNAEMILGSDSKGTVNGNKSRSRSPSKGR